MASLVEEIQREAIDENVSVSTLLRKVKLAAFKLRLEQTEDWVARELDGYNVEVPDYRILRGTVRYNNGYTGWTELLGDTSKFSMRATGQSVPEIEAMLQEASNQGFRLVFPENARRKLDEACGGPPASYALFIDRAQLAGLLAAVRGLVLDWAIGLEKAGILGEGMTFSKEEKKVAEDRAASITIGAVGSFNGNIGVGNSIENITIGDISIDAARNALQQLKANASSLAEVSSDPEQFRARLLAVEEQLSKAAPDQNALRSVWGDLRSSLNGAAGNIIASGALALINSVLGTGVPAP